MSTFREDEPLYTLAPWCGSHDEELWIRTKCLPRHVVREGQEWPTRIRIDIGLGTAVELLERAVAGRSSSCWNWGDAIWTRKTSKRKPPTKYRSACMRAQACRQGIDYHQIVYYDGDVARQHSKNGILQYAAHHPISRSYSLSAGCVGLATQKCRWSDARGKYNQSWHWCNESGTVERLLASKFDHEAIATLIKRKMDSVAEEKKHSADSLQTGRGGLYRRLAKKANHCWAVPTPRIKKCLVGRRQITARGASKGNIEEMK